MQLYHKIIAQTPITTVKFPPDEYLYIWLINDIMIDFSL